MNTVKGWDRNTMMSLFLKEATYDAGVAMEDTNACSMMGYDLSVDWPDKVAHDKDDVTGSEHGTVQEILTQGVKMTYKEDKAKPNSLAGLATLVLGSNTPTQDGAIVAYRHHIVPVTYGTALPSMQVEDKFAGIQYAYNGVKGASLKLSGKPGGYLSLEAALVGSGTRATSATAFAAAISESWMKMGSALVFLETGANIAVVSSPAYSQGAENISSATPDALSPRLTSFEFTFDNDLEGQFGFGGGDVLVDADYKRRKIGLKFSLLFNDSAELAYYLAQNPCAFELNLKGAQIVTASPASTLYYGAIIQVPKFYLKDPPLPKGGPKDIVMADFDCEVVDDGTNPAAIIEVFNAQAAYLAAA
jgi:hypothetical protein